MAGIYSMDHSRLEAHFNNQINLVIAHLKNNEKPQALKIFEATICPYLGDGELLNGNVESVVQQLIAPLATFDSGIDMAKAVAKVAKEKIPNFECTTVLESPKPVPTPLRILEVPQPIPVEVVINGNSFSLGTGILPGAEGKPLTRVLKRTEGLESHITKRSGTPIQPKPGRDLNAEMIRLFESELSPREQAHFHRSFNNSPENLPDLVSVESGVKSEEMPVWNFDDFTPPGPIVLTKESDDFKSSGNVVLNRDDEDSDLAAAIAASLVDSGRTREGKAPD